MNITQLMKQAQQMQKKINKLTKEFESKEFEFAAQQNMITGKMKGNLEIVELHIHDELLKEDKTILQDMLMITLNESINKVCKEKEDTLNKATNGVDVSMFM